MMLIAIAVNPRTLLVGRRHLEDKKDEVSCYKWQCIVDYRIRQGMSVKQRNLLVVEASRLHPWSESRLKYFNIIKKLCELSRPLTAFTLQFYGHFDRNFHGVKLYFSLSKTFLYETVSLLKFVEFSYEKRSTCDYWWFLPIRERWNCCFS